MCMVETLVRVSPEALGRVRIAICSRFPSERPRQRLSRVLPPPPRHDHCSFVLAVVMYHMVALLV